MSGIDIESFEDEWDDDAHLVAPRSRKLSHAARQRIESFEIARVVAVDRGRIAVWHSGAVTEAPLAGTMRGTKAVVGDRVRVRPPRHEGDLPRIVEVMDRDSVLLRTGDDAVDDERVVVANADQVVVVVAADHLDAGIGLLDRVMVAAAAGGLDAVLCVNKRDLVADLAPIDALVHRYRALGVEGHVTCALTGVGVDALGDGLRGRWSAFAGHSGVGKSSLFNRIVPDAEQAVGALGRYGGRHTTVAARAVHVASLDAWLVDTPGLRSFGLGHVEPSELRECYPELAGLECALDDCLHEREPGCDLASADIHPDRLASYRRLLDALRQRGESSRRHGL